jgi:hypothetical protein
MRTRVCAESSESAEPRLGSYRERKKAKLRERSSGNRTSAYRIQPMRKEDRLHAIVFSKAILNAVVAGVERITIHREIRRLAEHHKAFVFLRTQYRESYVGRRRDEQTGNLFPR